jgi:hypothetical protein
MIHARKQTRDTQEGGIILNTRYVYMLQRNMVKCDCHRLKYVVLYYKRVITLILLNSLYIYYTPRKHSFLGGYIGITLSVRPSSVRPSSVRPSVLPSVHVPCKRGDDSTYTFTKAQLLLSGLLECCETLHSCSALPADVHEGIWLLSKIQKGR